MSGDRRNLFTAYGPEVAGLAERAASLVERTVPSARQTVREGWQCLAFTHPDIGYFCGVFPRSGVVQVGFEFGTLLPDPEGLLQGGGAQLRYVVLVPGEPFPIRSLAALLEAAVALPPSASVRRSMARTLTGAAAYPHGRRQRRELAQGGKSDGEGQFVGARWPVRERPRQDAGLLRSRARHDRHRRERGAPDGVSLCEAGRGASRVVPHGREDGRRRRQGRAAGLLFTPTAWPTCASSTAGSRRRA